MGGVGTFLEIETAELPEGRKRSTPRALHTAISRAILDRIWSGCSYGAFRHTAGEYLSDERSDAKEHDLWSATPTELSWTFMDHAGCCNGSSEACYHWFSVCLTGFRERWDKMAATRGFRITTPAWPAAAVLFGVAYPLVAHGNQPLCVPGFAPGKLDWKDEWGGPFWDDGAPRPRLSDFDPADRAVVVHAALTGICTCAVCRELKPWSLARRSPVETLEKAWLALSENAALRARASVVRTEVSGYDAWRGQPGGPPALNQLREELVEPPLPWELAGMCFRLR